MGGETNRLPKVVKGGADVERWGFVCDADRQSRLCNLFLTLPF